MARIRIQGYLKTISIVVVVDNNEMVSHQRLRARTGDKVEDGSGVTVGGKNLFFRRVVDRDILFQFRLRNYTYPRSFVLELTLCPQLRGER